MKFWISNVTLLWDNNICVDIFSYSGPSGILGSDGKQNTAWGVGIVALSIFPLEREREREREITSTIFPPATTAIISASLIVLSLCAITNTVLPEVYKVKG